MSTNERTFIRTIVKWSKQAVILAALIVLLVVGVFVQKAHALEISKANYALVESQTKASKIESNLKTVETQKTALEKDTAAKDAKIQQLEQENASLK